MENDGSNTNDSNWNPHISSQMNHEYRWGAYYPYIVNNRYTPFHYAPIYYPQRDTYVKETTHATDMANINGVLTQMGTDIGKMKHILELSRNDILIANSYIDKTTNEYKKLGKKCADMEYMMGKHIDKTDFLVSKMNKLQKKIEKIDRKEESLKKNIKMDKKTTNVKTSTEDIIRTDNLSKEIKSDECRKQKISNTASPHHSKESLTSKPILPLLSFFSFLSDIDKHAKVKKESDKKIVETDDNYDINDPIYADDNEMKFKIENIEDLIKLGEKLKKEREINKKSINKNTINEDTDEDSTKSDIVKLIIDDVKNDPSTEPAKMVIKPVNSSNKYDINVDHIIDLNAPLKKLQKMVGIQNVKTQLFNMILYFLQNFEDKRENMLHTTIEGPPGIGKSKLCDILAGVYAAMGVVKTNKVVRVRRPDLIAEYVGQTAHRTQRAIDDAEDGVLIIDEAYGLGESEGKDSYAKECIDIINQNLTEKKKSLVVIIAGYTDQLDRCFFSYNDGLKRRFPFRFVINKYTPVELKEIFYDKIRSIKWRLHKNLSSEYLVRFFGEKYTDFQHFGGDIETLLLNCKFVHSKRVFGKDVKYKKIITVDDFEKAFEEFKNNGRKKDENHAMMYI